MNNICIGKHLIDSNRPRIIVPIAEFTQEKILQQARRLTHASLDIVEWRVDYYEQAYDIHKILDTLRMLRSILEDIPLIFTCRSLNEGGRMDMSSEYYRAMYQRAIESTLVDAVDIEIFAGEHQVRTLIALAHTENVTVICSNHDSHETPSTEVLLSRLEQMKSLGADIAKLVVTAHSAMDISSLICASTQSRENDPQQLFIVLCMGHAGLMTRLFPEEFGSCLAYAAMGNRSAPGQLPLEDYRAIQQLLRNSQTPLC